MEIPLARIRENPRQPRLRMDDDALAGLAESIRQHGVIQPILVTETIDGYQLVAGERRVRAARAAGLEHIPAVVRQLADRQQLELALVENLQREDLDPIEAARAYRQLMDEFSFTQEDLARAGGPGPLDGREHASPARARPGRPGRRRGGGSRGPRTGDRRPAYRGAGARRCSVIDDDLSVRQTEALVRSSGSARRGRGRVRGAYAGGS